MSSKQISLALPASEIRCPVFEGKGNLKNIVIRPHALHDAPAIVEAVSESLTELKEFMPWAHFEPSVDYQRTRIAGLIGSYWRGEDHTFGVHSEDGTFLGGFGLHARASNSNALEIGYWMRTKFSGQGLTTAAVKALIVYGFEYLGLERIQCGHDRDNQGSAVVNDKCGFIIEGEMPGFLPMGNPEWRKDGWKSTGTMVMRRLLPFEAQALTWYNNVKKNLKVYDWQGVLVQ